MPDLKLPDSAYESMIPLDTTNAMSLSREPLLLASGVRRSPKLNYFKMNFVSDNPGMDLHLVRDLPKNFAMSYRSDRHSNINSNIFKCFSIFSLIFMTEIPSEKGRN